MVNTRTTEPRLLDDTLRSTILQVVQEANAPEDQKLRLVSMHLYDKALEWHKQFVKIRGENVLWPEYEKEITARFNSVFEDPMVEIKNLKQDGEVKVYQEQFEVLLNRLDLNESYAEATLALLKVKPASQYGGYRSNSGTYANRYVSSSTPVTKSVLALPSATTKNVGKIVKTGLRKQLTQKELEEKRAKGLCFYCDQKYAPGHKCPGQLYSLEVSVDEEDQEEEVCNDTEYISAMRVRGYVGKQPLHILIDCGSTHNFLDTSSAKRLPCQLSATIPLRVDVANRSKMVSSSECKTFKWTLQGNEYEADCMLLPLGGCDMVLGIQWLSTLGDINCNFKNLTMKFNYQGKKVVCFAMPTALPPPRAHDHTISLLPNTPPITVKPYRLPPNQKDVVEQMVKELLDAGVIRESQSPFSSPIVMVKKKDGTWRMCVDYSASEKEHLQHLKAVLEVMRVHTLYAKQSKCIFLAPQVKYLGHVLFAQGVATDPLKIKAMTSWPIPKTLKQLRGFLGLTGYYRSNDSSPVLALPNFEKEFVVETDASGSGIGIVLHHQEGHPSAYLSKALSPKHQALSTYEKEFLAVMMALDKWRGYMLDRHFKIKTDHFSLKYLLDQRLTTPFQTKWLPKLLGFDYEISYKKGAENGAADALSMCSEFNTLIATIVTMICWTQDKSLHSLIQKFLVNPNTPSKFDWQSNQLTRRGKLVVGDVPELKDYLFDYVHATFIGGHSEVQVTLQNLKAMVYWKGMKKWVKNKVKACDVCQRNKPDLSAYPGYLQLLPIPPTIWSSISMDFIEGLPSSPCKTIIFVVVDRLNKYAHFMALHHPFTASTVAQVFMDNVFKLHGLPHSIISDRDKVFLSNFWKSLFKVLKVNLHMSTAYHPQLDGQTEVVNRCLECYLRCMTGDKPKEWMQWLSLAEYWYNTNFHSSTNITPFVTVYVQPLPTYVPYESGDSPVESVDRSLQAREHTIQQLKFHLQRSQDRMRNLANKHKTDRQFEVRMWVYVKLQPHRQVTLRKSAYNKLSSKYYVPFQVVKKVGYKVDYTICWLVYS
ncbi:retrotransposon-related protein [Tanacetum coccineum]|uniref:RNA-directed DNA polymerase n=1 Tax=Tanacetum coccineum TaxID=301880 RepID=A0ABQ5DS81_9ASTR